MVLVILDVWAVELWLVLLVFEIAVIMMMFELLLGGVVAVAVILEVKVMAVVVMVWDFVVVVVVVVKKQPPVQYPMYRLIFICYDTEITPIVLTVSLLLDIL